MLPARVINFKHRASLSLTCRFHVIFYGLCPRALRIDLAPCAAVFSTLILRSIDGTENSNWQWTCAFVNFKTRERWQKGAQIENCKATLEGISTWKLRKSFSSFHFDILYSSLTFVQLLQPDCVTLRFLSCYVPCIINCYIKYATVNSINASTWLLVCKDNRNNGQNGALSTICGYFLNCNCNCACMFCYDYENNFSYQNSVQQLML